MSEGRGREKCADHDGEESLAGNIERDVLDDDGGGNDFVVDRVRREGGHRRRAGRRELVRGLRGAVEPLLGSVSRVSGGAGDTHRGQGRTRTGVGRIAREHRRRTHRGVLHHVPVTLSLAHIHCHTLAQSHVHITIPYFAIAASATPRVSFLDLSRSAAACEFTCTRSFNSPTLSPPSSSKTSVSSRNPTFLRTESSGSKPHQIRSPDIVIFTLQPLLQSDPALNVRSLQLFHSGPVMLQQARQRIHRLGPQFRCR